MSLAVVHHPAYRAPLPRGHRFPMTKFARLFDILIDDNIISTPQVVEPEPAPREWIELAHAPYYVGAVFEQSLDRAAVRRIGLPVTAAIIARARAAVGGTVETARLALARGLACNTAGGSHHAHSDHGAGFCVFNDVAVAIRVLAAEGAIARALVIDLDVHQGDGTAEIFASDGLAFTFSMHCAANYPARKRTSDRDVALPPGVGDTEYLAALEVELAALLPELEPDIVFYNAGVDPHRDDSIGRLDLTDTGLRARERMVLETCLGAGVPVAAVIGGGYANDIDALARRHATLHKTGAALASARDI